MIKPLETIRVKLYPLRVETRRTRRRFSRVGGRALLANRVRWPCPTDGALLYYRDVVIPAVERSGHRHWSLRVKNENRGFWIGRPWQGRRLISEAVDEVTAFCFEELETRAEGDRECGVAEDFGKNRHARGSHGTERLSGRLPTEICEITAEE
jgi:ribosomal-protein-alanine N-acetyltransferase